MNGELNLLRDFAIIMGVALAVTLPLRLLRQPPVLGYLAAGQMARAWVAVNEARELWRHLIASMKLYRPEPQEAWQEALHIILEHGTLAHRILRAVGDDYSRDRLQAIYRELCDCLEEDRMFLGMR